jgi:hypothetical protein
MKRQSLVVHPFRKIVFLLHGPHLQHQDLVQLERHHSLQRQEEEESIQRGNGHKDVLL